jgi:hypothetical protein
LPVIVFDLTDDLLAEFDDEVSTHLPTVAMAREIRRRRAAETVVPPMIQAGIDRYAQHGIPPRSCLRAILEGDLFAAFTCADPGTRTAMGAIVDKISSTLHRSVYGTAAKVSAYLNDCQKLREAFDKPFTGSDKS